MWKINIKICLIVDHINGLVQDYSNSSALAMELLQSCAKLYTAFLYMIIKYSQVLL